MEKNKKRYVINEMTEFGNVFEIDKVKVVSRAIVPSPKLAIWQAALFAENAKREMEEKGWQNTDISLFDDSIMVAGIAYEYREDGKKVQKYWNRRFTISVVEESHILEA